MTLTILRCGPGVTIQDLGRPGRLHDGLPPSGALVPELLRAANDALGNDPKDACLEVMRHSLTLTTDAPLSISVDGAIHTLAPNAPLVVTPAPEAVAYVAVPGGFDVPMQLGSRSTLLVASLGRMIRSGDRLQPRRSDPTRLVEVTRPALSTAPIRIVPGPDAFPDDALKCLISQPFRISTLGDRTGTRLDGPKLPTPADRPYSAPMLRGAIQVSHDGTPIVLGPDHPVTGGYAVIATILRADIGRFARLVPGAEVSFAEFAKFAMTAQAIRERLKGRDLGNVVDDVRAERER